MKNKNGSNRTKLKCVLAGLVFTSSLAAFGPSFKTAFSAEEVVVYTARKEHLVKPLFDAFKKETGINVKYRTDKAGALVEKIKSEGTRSPADILFTVDAGNLWYAAEQGILWPTMSKVLDKNVPTHLKDPKNQWFGLSVRARTVVYNPSKVKASELKSYEDLADKNWKGRVCLRTSKKVYNQSLVAMMIEEFGETQTQEVVKGWVGNLATKVFSNDTQLIQAVDAGKCHVGIVNTYYFGRLQKKNPNLNVKMFWPNQNSTGVHVNVSGAGILKTSKNKENALKLLEWLSEKNAQKVLADLNMEYPVNPTVSPAKIVKDWGDFKPSKLNVAFAGKLQAKAVKLMDRVGYE